MACSTLSKARAVGSVRSVALASIFTSVVAASAVVGAAKAAPAPIAQGVLAPVSNMDPERLVQSTGNLYWTTNNLNEFGPSSSRVIRASKLARPGEHRVLYRLSHNGNVQFAALAYARVGNTWFGYVVSNNTRAHTSRILRVPLAGGAATTLVTSPSYIGLRDLVTDGSSLYWADEGGIRRVPLAGGEVKPLVTGTSTVSRLDLGGGRLYFAFGFSIRSMPASGGSITTFAATSSPVTALDVTSFLPPRVLWGQADNAVKSRSVFGGTVSTHSGPVANRRVTSVASDAFRILWTSCSPTNNACSTLKRSGGTTVAVAVNRVGSKDVQGDATAMFWGDHAVERFTH